MLGIDDAGIYSGRQFRFLPDPAVARLDPHPIAVGDAVARCGRRVDFDERMPARFISAEANGVVDCVEGALVRPLKEGACVNEMASDNYGDFRFDRLDEGSGPYTVEITACGCSTRIVTATLGESINLGEITL
jgi:hypothetical protein